MTRVYLEQKSNKWNEVDKSDFWIDKALLEKLKNIKMIQEKEWDGVLLIDGKERSGKSTLGMICGWYLSNGILTEKNFARGLSDIAAKITELPDKSVLIVDEGSMIFSSRDSSVNAQKKLMKILDVVGQKRLIFIICLPCFFDLNKTIAVRRSLFLCHVYPDDKYDRGQYAFWGEKGKSRLYRYGKKDFDSYQFPRAEFLGEYFQFKPPFYEKYLKEVKAASLREVLADAVEPHKAIDPRPVIAYRFKVRFPEVTDIILAEIFDISRSMINMWIDDQRTMNYHKILIEKDSFAKEKSVLTTIPRIIK